MKKYDFLHRLDTSNLTAKQKRIYDLILAGESQVSIAKKLGVVQCTISKAVFGAMQKDGRRYGGLLKKLNKQITDEFLRTLQDQIHAEVSATLHPVPSLAEELTKVRDLLAELEGRIASAGSK